MLGRGILLFAGIFAGLTLFPQLVKDRENLTFVIPSLLLCFPFFFRSCWPQPNEGLGRWVMQGFAVGCAILGLLLWLPIGGWIGTPLVLPHSLENADAIVVLASGIRPDGRPVYSGYQRVIHGVELYKAGRAPHLVFSTGDRPDRENNREDAWVASFAALVGLASGSFEIVSHMIDTRGEAKTCAERLFPRNMKKILLVTNGTHILRGVRVFEKQGFQVLPAPVQLPEHLTSSQQGFLGLYDSVVHEWIGLAVYWLRGDIETPFR